MADIAKVPVSQTGGSLNFNFVEINISYIRSTRRHLYKCLTAVEKSWQRNKAISLSREILLHGFCE